MKSLCHWKFIKNKNRKKEAFLYQRQNTFNYFEMIVVSKEELYFIKENYEIFSTEVSAREKQGQNNSGPH